MKAYYLRKDQQTNEAAKLETIDDWFHYMVYSMGISIPDHEMDEIRQTLADGRCYLFKSSMNTPGGDRDFNWILTP